ncbi:MAG: hypothetical protein FJ308_17825, partial [Planctomycetes bacterium]|nr:hypothetical protein [Planctomycetota bacterium]
MFFKKSSGRRLVLAVPPPRARNRAKSLARRRLRRLVIEGLETRVMLAGDLTIRSLADLQPYYDSADNTYSYDAGHPGATSRVTFAADIITSGSSISIDADEIYVDPSITIDTSNPNGKAGNISFDAHTKVYLSDNSKLLANGIDDSQDGSITISASHDMQTRANFTAINMVENLINAFTSPAEITILSGVTIDGGDISIKTENGNHKMEYGSAVLDQRKKAWKVAAAASPVPSSILSLPVTFQDWRPKARITINQSADATNTTKILGSSSVTIGADAHASAVGKAVSASIPQMLFNKSDNNPNGWFGQKKLKTAWSAGVFLTDPEATVDIVNTIVSSGGNVSISSDVENTISLTAKSTLNTGAGKTNPAGKAFSFALSFQSSTSTVYVDSNSLISSQGGVSITADAINSSSTTSSSAVYRDGTVGAAPAIADNHTNVKVTIDGKVTAIRPTTDGSIPPKPSFNSTFNPTFSVDIPSSTVTLSGIPLYKTGDAIALFSEEGGTLPGLAAGLYYVIVTPNFDNTYSLQFASSYEDALALKYISFGDAYPTLTNLRTNLAIPVTQTATDTQQQSLILFSDANGPDGATP